MEGSKEGTQDAGHIHLCEVGVVLGGGFLIPQQGHEAGHHHEGAELHGAGVWKGASRAVKGGLPLLGLEGDLSRPSVGGHLPGPLGTFRKAVHRRAKALVAAADGEQRVQGPVPQRAPDVGAVRLVHPGVLVGAWAVQGGGGCIRRGGGSRCRGPPSCPL